MPTRRDNSRAPRFRPWPPRITAPLAAAIDAGISPRLETAFHASAPTVVSRPPLRIFVPGLLLRHAAAMRDTLVRFRLHAPPFMESSFRRRAVSPTHDIRNGCSRYRSL